jgi:predicted nucleic acid-binding protein
MFLLDTNVVSELRCPDRVHPHVAAWMERIDPGETYLSVVSVLELEQGVLSLSRRRCRTGTKAPAMAREQCASFIRRSHLVD